LYEIDADEVFVVNVNVVAKSRQISANVCCVYRWM